MFFTTIKFVEKAKAGLTEGAMGPPVWHACFRATVSLFFVYKYTDNIQVGLLPGHQGRVWIWT